MSSYRYLIADFFFLLINVCIYFIFWFGVGIIFGPMTYPGGECNINMILEPSKNAKFYNSLEEANKAVVIFKERGVNCVSNDSDLIPIKKEFDDKDFSILPYFFSHWVIFIDAEFKISKDAKLSKRTIIFEYFDGAGKLISRSNNTINIMSKEESTFTMGVLFVLIGMIVLPGKHYLSRNNYILKINPINLACFIFPLVNIYHGFWLVGSAFVF